jgi:hypothetical protein
MKNETEQLKILLGYWLEHNEEHAGEFREWASKIASRNKDVSDLLQQAVAKMAESNEYLNKAKSALEKN